MSELTFDRQTASKKHNSWRWVCLLTILTNCQSGAPGSEAIDTALESEIVSGLRNLPARVFPNEYERVAYVDRDFKVSDAQASDVGEFAVVKTYFATNRGYNADELPYRMFNEASTNNITFGKIIPNKTLSFL